MSACCLSATPPLRLTGDGTTGDCWCLDLATADSDCITLGVSGNALRADVTVDPDPCNSLECRPTGLFAPAEHMAQGIELNGAPLESPATVLNFTMDANDPAFAEIETQELVAEIANPSDCRDALLFVVVGGPSPQLRIDAAGGDVAIRYRLQASIDGGPWQSYDVSQIGLDSGSGAMEYAFGEQSIPIQINMTPSQTVTVAMRRRFVAVVGDPTVLSSGDQRISGILVTV